MHGDVCGLLRVRVSLVVVHACVRFCGDGLCGNLGELALPATGTAVGRTNWVCYSFVNWYIAVRHCSVHKKEEKGQGLGRWDEEIEPI